MSRSNTKSNKGSPFSALESLRNELKKEKPVRQDPVADEAELIARAFQGVRPIDRGEPRPRPKKLSQPKNIEIDEDTEAFEELQGIVDGTVPLDYTVSDEFIEGRALDCSRLELARLRNAEFAVQGNIDLHGMTREQARGALTKFFQESISKRHRCVLVICGRGLRSPGGKPVLKHLLARWLAIGQLSRSVLAFCSAKAYDGGTGAVYVLLRRNPKR